MKNNNDIKVCEDGFVWKVLPKNEAMVLWNAGVFPLYCLYSDDSEGQIDSEEELKEAIFKGIPIGIEVGYLPKGWMPSQYIANLQELSTEGIEMVTEIADISRDEAFKLIQEWAQEFTQIEQNYNSNKTSMSYYDLIDEFLDQKRTLLMKEKEIWKRK